MNKITTTLLIHCIVVQAYCMEQSIEIQPKPQKGLKQSLHRSNPRIMLKQAAHMYIEANVACITERPMSERIELFQHMRHYLSEIFALDQRLREKGDTQACLRQAELIDARFWMAQMLASGLGGAPDHIKTRELCVDLLREEAALPTDIKQWVNEVMQALDKKYEPKTP